MSLIVGVHGIGQQFKGPETLRSEWFSALCDGLYIAGQGGSCPNRGDFSYAFYGDFFRKLQPALAKPPHPAVKAANTASKAPVWDLDALDMEYVEAFAAAAKTIESQRGVQEPNGAASPQTKGVIGSAVAGALHLGLDRAMQWLTSRPWLGSMLEAAVITDIQQVRAYLCDKPEGIRKDIRSRVSDLIKPDTRLVIAHSLGSVVAYEALCALGGAQVDTFITIGSPLGMEKVVHARLDPKPVNGRAPWPGKVRRWINIADRGDIVATEHKLKDRFAVFPDGSGILDLEVSNGLSDPHSSLHYLTSAAVGQAISEAKFD